MVMTPRGSSVGFNSGVPWYEYLHSQGWAIAHYLRLVIIPVGLTLDYGFRVVPHWRGVPGLLLLTALALLTIAAWTRANRWGWAAFLEQLVLPDPRAVVELRADHPGADRRAADVSPLLRRSYSSSSSLVTLRFNGCDR